MDVNLMDYRIVISSIFEKASKTVSPDILSAPMTFASCSHWTKHIAKHLQNEKNGNFIQTYAIWCNRQLNNLPDLAFGKMKARILIELNKAYFLIDLVYENNQYNVRIIEYSKEVLNAAIKKIPPGNEGRMYEGPEAVKKQYEEGILCMQEFFILNYVKKNMEYDKETNSFTTLIANQTVYNKDIQVGN